MAHHLQIALGAILKRPGVKHSATAFVAWTSGDLLTQVVEERVSKKCGNTDFSRAFTSGCYGALLVTPLATRWYGPTFKGGLNLLSPTIRARVDNWGWLSTSLLQSGLTFLCMAPTFCVTYVSWMGFFYKEHSKLDIFSSVRQTMKPILICDAMFWPAADLFNFAVVPEKYRFFAMLAEDVLWAAVLAVWGFNHEEINHLVQVSNGTGTTVSHLIQEAFRSDRPIFLTAAFWMLDKDRSGRIDKRELQEFLKGLDVEITATGLFDEEGKASMHALKSYLAEARGKPLLEMIQFRIMDMDRNHLVDWEEMKAVMGLEVTQAAWKFHRLRKHERITAQMYMEFHASCS